MHIILRALILAVLLTAICLCQSKDDYIVYHQKTIQNEFESSYGEGWQFSWNLNDTPHRIFGKSISQNFDGFDPFQSEIAAREFISSHQSLFNLTENSLELWVNEQHGNLRYLIFNQVYNGIAVWNGRIDFRYRLNGDLVMIGHDAFPNINLNTNPGVSKDQAIIYSQAHVNFDEYLNDEVVGDPVLYIWVEKAEQPIYHLAWLTELFVHSTDPYDELPIHRW